MTMHAQMTVAYITNLIEITESMVGVYPSDSIIEAMCAQLETLLLMLEEPQHGD